ncbi:hypothetical protein PIB30_047432 [Stylosanthes scabra]|uniref:Uncharacterized protein n=1 Tax=Stylosanthes scabra TaxID=79078 RepID=A0ABU6UIM1_9FABA|nr:hypothetical protein [Stylosanthes scabra]
MEGGFGGPSNNHHLHTIMLDASSVQMITLLLGLGHFVSENEIVGLNWARPNPIPQLATVEPTCEAATEVAVKNHPLAASGPCCSSCLLTRLHQIQGRFPATEGPLPFPWPR